MIWLEMLAVPPLASPKKGIGDGKVISLPFIIYYREKDITN